MGAMRAALAALAGALLVVASGCGGASGGNAAAGRDSAGLVPPGALAFASVDTHLDSAGWKTIERLTGGLPMLQQALRKQGLQLEQDVKPALGDELGVAVLGVDNGRPEAIALTQSQDEAKLRTLASKFDRGTEHYTVERIGGWSVVADSKEAFDAVRGAQSGRSLADVPEFQAAAKELGGGSIAFAYASGAGLQKVAAGLGDLAASGGTPRWAAAQVTADGSAVRVKARLESTSAAASSSYEPRLLKDVPSGALLAVSFKDAQTGLKRFAGAIPLGLPLADLAPALRGEGVFYLAQGVVIPTLVLELDSPDPAAAATALRAVATRLTAKAGGAVKLNVLRQGSRVYLTNGASIPSPGARLVDDQPFKDALAAAHVPKDVTFLAYADVQRLAPVLQALSQLLAPSSRPGANGLEGLDRLGTLVAFGARAGSASRIELRLTGR
jgi:hypothetical protein